METLETRQLLSQLHKPAATHQTVRRLVAHTASTAQVANPGDGFDMLDEATAARNQFGVDGTGLAAAVIDTGVNYNNAALGGGLGSGKKVEDGYDFADGTGDPDATTSQHGTAVAGLIASNDPTDPGVAPGADIVALRVFGDTDDGNFDNVANALQWVIDHHTKDHITVVNLSISDGDNYSLDLFSSDGGIGQQIETLVDELAALNIPVVTAAGNDFTGQQGMGFPAILPDTISVTATDGGSVLASDAQRLGPIGGTSATDLAAPGVGLTAPVQGNDLATVDGTSFAAPQVSGAIILLQQIYEQRFGSLPTVSALEGWLQAGSVAVHDSSTGINIGRLDILKAAELIPSSPITSAPNPTSGSEPSATEPASGTPLSIIPSPVKSSSALQAATDILSSVSTITPAATSASTPALTTSIATTPQVGAASSTPSSVILSPPIIAIPVPSPVAPVSTPPNIASPVSAPSTTTSVPQTEIIVNGEPSGSVDSGSSADPFSAFSSLFGIDAVFSTVQVWESSSSSSSSSTSTVPGSAAAMGTVHIMLERAKKTPVHVSKPAHVRTSRAKTKPIHHVSKPTHVPKIDVPSHRPKYPKAI